MNHADFVGYFRSLAQTHPDIASNAQDSMFLNVDLFDDANLTTKPTAIKWAEGKFAMVVEDPEYGLEGDRDQQRWTESVAIWIVAPTGRDSLQRRGEVKNGALQVVKSLIWKLQEDSDSEQPPHSWLRGIVEGSLIIQKLGPIWDDCFGWRLSFEVLESANSELNDYRNTWD